MFEIEKPTIEEWCKDNWYSVSDHWIQELYQEYIYVMIIKYEIDWIESDGRLRISVTTWNNKTHIAWYWIWLEHFKLSNAEIEMVGYNVEEIYKRVWKVREMLEI